MFAALAVIGSALITTHQLVTDVEINLMLHFQESSATGSMITPSTWVNWLRDQWKVSKALCRFTEEPTYSSYASKSDLRPGRLWSSTS